MQCSCDRAADCSEAVTSSVSFLTEGFIRKSFLKNACQLGGVNLFTLTQGQFETGQVSCELQERALTTNTESFLSVIVSTKTKPQTYI